MYTLSVVSRRRSSPLCANASSTASNPVFGYVKTEGCLPNHGMCEVEEGSCYFSGVSLLSDLEMVCWRERCTPGTLRFPALAIDSPIESLVSRHG